MSQCAECGTPDATCECEECGAAMCSVCRSEYGICRECDEYDDGFGYDDEDDEDEFIYDD